MKYRIPTRLAKNASKLHKRIGELLTSEESIFKNYEIRQEYPVNKLNPSFKSGREKYDWIIITSIISVVIEAMGVQHFTFSPHFYNTKQDFIKQQERDEAKKQAALEAGCAYITVNYNELDITLQELTNRIQQAIEEVKLPEKEIISVKPKQKIQSRGFQKPPEGFKYKWHSRKLRSNKA